MANETAAIWQVQSGAGNGTESTAGAGNTILFNPSAVATESGYIFNTEINFRNSTPENVQVAGPNNEVQDMGLDGLDIQLTGIITDVDDNASGKMANKLVQWMVDGKTTTGFTEGRFGLRLDDFPQVGVVPTSTYGYVLSSLKLIRSDREDKAQFVLTLRLSGLVTSAINQAA